MRVTHLVRAFHVKRAGVVRFGGGTVLVSPGWWVTSVSDKVPTAWPGIDFGMPLVFGPYAGRPIALGAMCDHLRKEGAELIVIVPEEENPCALLS